MMAIAGAVGQSHAWDVVHRTVHAFGMMEMLVLLAIVMVMFGAKRLPELGDSLGKGIKNFKKSLTAHEAIEVTPKKEIADSGEGPVDAHVEAASAVKADVAPATEAKAEAATEAKAKAPPA